MRSITDRQFLAALYRGILRREPDEAGLLAHAAELHDAANERVLATKVGQFLHSEEHRIKQQRSDLLDQLRPARFADAPWEVVTSLGSHCYTSWVLKGDGLKRFSGPFDWIFSNLAMVRHCLEDDFRTFLDPNFYEVRPADARARPNEGVCDHRFYRDSFDVQLVFNHYDPTDPAVHGYFARAVDRFRQVLASPRRKLFLAISTPDRIGPEDFPALAGLLDGITTNARLLAFRVLPPTHDPRLFGVSTLDRRGAHQLFAFQPTSSLTGLGFADPFDDLVIRRHLRQMPFELAAVP